MSGDLSKIVIAQRKAKTIELLHKISENGISEKSITVAKFALDKGNREETIEKYVRMFVNAEKIQERFVDGVLMIGTYDAWKEFDARRKEKNEMRASMSR